MGSEMCIRDRLLLDQPDPHREPAVLAPVGASSAAEEVTAVGPPVSTPIVGSSVAPASLRFDPPVAMANAKIPELVAELETLKFQIEEEVEIVQDELLALSLKDLTEHQNEIKDLRVRLVRTQNELEQLGGGARHADSVKETTQSSKEVLKSVRARVAVLEKDKVKVEEDRVNGERAAEQQKNCLLYTSPSPRDS